MVNPPVEEEHAMTAVEERTKSPMPHSNQISNLAGLLTFQRRHIWPLSVGPSRSQMRMMLIPSVHDVQAKNDEAMRVVPR